jgi:membrane protease YdiL (CAAX protease family)
MGIERPPVWTWALAIFSAVVLVVAMHLPGLSLGNLPELLTAAQGRLHAAVQPTAAGLTAALLAVTAQELVFRGWLQRLGGPIVAAVAFVLVITPLEPVYGAIVAVLFGGLTHLSKGSVLPALAARWLATVAVWAWLAS